MQRTRGVGESVNVDEMNSFRAQEDDEQLTFQAASTEETMQDLMQSRSFSYEDDLEDKKKTGLYRDFIEKIHIFKPDLILCSVVEDTFLQAVKLLSLISDKKNSLFDEVFTTACPELALSYDNVDMVAVWEGEKIIVEVAERVRTQKLS